MKKYISTLAVCAVLALAACNGTDQKGQGVDNDATKVENSTPAPQETPPPTPSEGTTPPPTPSEGSTPAPAPEKTQEKPH